MAGALTDDVLQRLREAGAEDLRQLVMGLVGELDVPAALAVLRNPHVGEEVIRLLADQRRLLAFYELRRDLVDAGLDVRVRPLVRRAADQRLVERLPALAVGERIAIARRASRHVLQSLSRDPTGSVIGALLENPRLTEGDLLPLVASDAARPQVLEVVLGHRKWGSRYPVRAAAVRNPQAPLTLALRHLPLLKKVDLRAVATDPRLQPPLRRRAQVLLGEAT